MLKRANSLPMKKRTTAHNQTIDDQQALALHECISALMREFRIEPGLLAGSVYKDLHANDIGLFEVLAGSGQWSVRRIADALSAPITTISSALDRLERQGLVERKRIAGDRRVVHIELTARGRRLAIRLHNAHIENCRALIARLPAEDREGFLRQAARLAGR
jgi:DNA-binding MarR family transcriptional regulator